MSFDAFLDKEISKNARKPFKRPNPYEIPAGMPFYNWMEQSVTTPTLIELEEEKINHDFIQEQIIA